MKLTQNPKDFLREITVRKDEEEIFAQSILSYSILYEKYMTFLMPKNTNFQSKERKKKLLIFCQNTSVSRNFSLL